MTEESGNFQKTVGERGKGKGEGGKLESGNIPSLPGSHYAKLEKSRWGGIS